MVRKLTPRQLEVIDLLVKHPEATDQQLAQELNITVNTLHTHLYRIYDRLGSYNRLDCVLTCIKLGLIEVPI